MGALLIGCFMDWGLYGLGALFLFPEVLSRGRNPAVSENLSAWTVPRLHGPENRVIEVRFRQFCPR